MTKIYSKPANKNYLDNYDSIFGKKNQEEETYLERLKRLEDIGDRLFETKSQTKEEKRYILKELKSEKHITPSNKANYKPEPKSFMERLFGIIGRWYRK